MQPGRTQHLSVRMQPPGLPLLWPGGLAWTPCGVYTTAEQFSSWKPQVSASGKARAQRCSDEHGHTCGASPEDIQGQPQCLEQPSSHRKADTRTHETHHLSGPRLVNQPPTTSSLIKLSPASLTACVMCTLSLSHRLPHALLPFRDSSHHQLAR